MAAGGARRRDDSMGLYGRHARDAQGPRRAAAATAASPPRAPRRLSQMMMFGCLGDSWRVSRQRHRSRVPAQARAGLRPAAPARAEQGTGHAAAAKVPRHVLAAGADPRFASSSGITALDVAKVRKRPRPSLPSCEWAAAPSDLGSINLHPSSCFSSLLCHRQCPTPQSISSKLFAPVISGTAVLFSSPLSSLLFSSLLCRCVVLCCVVSS